MNSKKKQTFYLILALALILCILYLTVSCFIIDTSRKQLSRGSNVKYNSKDIVTNEEPAAGQISGIPEARSFYMGFTPFPYDSTPDAVAFTYGNINYHSDIIAHQLDNGVPWDEALIGSDYPKNLLRNLNDRISRTETGKKIYLAVTPLSTYRDGIAGIWGERENMELSGKWKYKSFNDPEIIESYLNYCNFLIERFKPDYFAYAVEANILGINNKEAFKDFLLFAEEVYKSLKNNYPELPVFMTFQLETFINNFESQEQIVKNLLAYTDIIGISSYPFGNFDDPADIPNDWFSRLYSIASEKPVAITETAFPAEDLQLNKLNRTIKGNPEWQFEYLGVLFNQMNSPDCRFIIWFAIRDYDLLWLKMQQQGADEIFKSWRDTGLIDENGKPRISLSLWDKWLSIK